MCSESPSGIRTLNEMWIEEFFGTIASLKLTYELHLFFIINNDMYTSFGKYEIELKLKLSFLKQ